MEKVGGKEPKGESGRGTIKGSYSGAAEGDRRDALE